MLVGRTNIELFTASEIMVNANIVPDDLKQEYEKKSVENRFNQYGGIIRHVLPSDLEEIKAKETLMTEAIENADLMKILGKQEIPNEIKDISHFLAQFVVEREGEKAFELKKIDFVSDDVRNRLIKKNFMI